MMTVTASSSCRNTSLDTDRQDFINYKIRANRVSHKGLNGIKNVEKGIQPSKLWFKEINTVVYDPRRITIEEMKDALKEAGTYKGVLKPEEVQE